jgi:hypothetical protein
MDESAARRHNPNQHQHNNGSRHHHSHHRNGSSTSTSTSSSHRRTHNDRRSRDRNDAEDLDHNVVGTLISEMRELRKENKLLNEKLAFFCEKVDRRLVSSERKIDSLSTALTTTAATSVPFVSTAWSSAPSFSASPLYIRKEILKDLPFLLDYDIISEQVPFLIDDLRYGALPSLLRARALAERATRSLLCALVFPLLSTTGKRSLCEGSLIQRQRRTSPFP